MKKLFVVFIVISLIPLFTLALTIDPVNSRDASRAYSGDYEIAVFPELEGPAPELPQLNRPPNLATVPEPLTLITVGVGLFGIGCGSLLIRRKRQS